jgi:hypothetical protein
MSFRLIGDGAPPGTWVRASAWAALGHVVFQFAAMALTDNQSSGWSVSTMAQAILVAILGYGAFRRNIFALNILGLLGGWRVLQLAGTILRLRDDTAMPLSSAVLVELVVTIPIALLWIIGGISALRSRWMTAVPG